MSLTIRLQPGVKEVLRLVAQKERRSVSNMVEVMIVEYGHRLGIEEKQAQHTGKAKR